LLNKIIIYVNKKLTDPKLWNSSVYIELKSITFTLIYKDISHQSLIKCMIINIVTLTWQQIYIYRSSCTFDSDMTESDDIRVDEL